MTNFDIARLRIQNQHIAKQTFKRPEEIVARMGAVQAQDYAGAKWALGLRLQNSSDAKIDRALQKGSIIRTHVLRPTWHFVIPEDARWMLDLSAARIKASAAAQYRTLGLNEHVFGKAKEVLGKALQGGKQIARPELQKHLAGAGIPTNEQRFIHLLMNAELDKVICSGGRQGKQFSFALFDERVPAASPITKEEALAKLAQRYFISHGPATLHDFAWWAGITLTDSKAGVEAVKGDLTAFEVGGRSFWMTKDLPDMAGKSPLAHLLPAYDEFTVAYADRDAAVYPKYLPQDPFALLSPTVVVNNQIVGSWKREAGKKAAISLNLFGKLSKANMEAVETAKRRYQKFVG